MRNLPHLFMTRKFSLSRVWAMVGVSVGVVVLTQCASESRPPGMAAGEAGTFSGDGESRREGAGGLRFGDKVISNNAIDGMLSSEAGRGRGMAVPPSPASVESSPRLEDRPGLATQAGGVRHSPVNPRKFFRQVATEPDAMEVIYYNDEAGARAMVESLGGGRRKKGTFEVAGGKLEMKVRFAGWGDPLPRYEAGGRRIVVGEGGRGYVLSLKNLSDNRSVEVVASVDGLDVMDGKPASVKKRGYVLPAKGTLEIEGFREDEWRVRQFVFGRVADSEAAKAGQARNVGVIGLAVFEEDEGKARAYGLAEAQQRGEAWAFPGGGR